MSYYNPEPDNTLLIILIPVVVCILLILLGGCTTSAGIKPVEQVPTEFVRVVGEQCPRGLKKFRHVQTRGDTIVECK